MNILKVYEVQGVNFENKGAELMLIAVAQRLRLFDPSATAVVPFRIGSQQQRRELGVGRLMAFHRERFRGSNALLGSLVGMLSRQVRNQLKVYRPSDLSAVLDASGFRYSDQWGVRSIVDQAAKARLLSKTGRPLIFLPQAFGPFSTRESQAAAKLMVEHSSLVFARDTTSLHHLYSACGKLPQIRKAPDFTNLVLAETPPFPLAAGTMIVVPNSRMIDKTDSSTASGYIDFLQATLSVGVQNGFVPAIMIHDALGDRGIARQLQSRLGFSILELSDPRPQVLKGWLAQAAVVIGSRFHALVGSLSAGTPTISVGWSHKYNELMEDYGSPELSVAVTDFELVKGTIELWSDEVARLSTSERLKATSSRLKEETLKMWQQVESALGPVG